MTGFNRKQCIDNFIRGQRQPFVNVFPVSKGRVDCDGYITLWNFAKGSKHEVRRSEEEIRTLSSRILNFICLHRYSKVRITQSSYARIEKSFTDDEDTLYSWAMNSKRVDFIARRLKVPADDLLTFLFPPEQSNDEDFDADMVFDLDDLESDDDLAPTSYGSRPTFDSNQMYKPDRERRHQWFSDEWNVV